ncbi:PAS domain-containing sensor histidine kinase [Asticcacaulis sp. YBE204]|uniref:sensor histidine kinase n=1 Tax=Asticcacaulis sp. YBE204 TaxID=1282363 RepID=UPI0003C3EDD0|nr:HAMP domain-containing sensor histidine kinase [Asticcacaulis sp. YBE204]ESQ79650.1 hypothetical protein AEYBE204_07350 [Asticcacaulis sp. YBE204]
MDYRRLLLALGAQIGVFILGALSWLALTRGLFASALLCGLGALGLAVLGLSLTALNLTRERLLNRLAPGSTFPSELNRRRLQLLLDETPSPLLLQTEDGQLIAVNRAARSLFDVAYALPVASRKVLLGGDGALTGLGGQVRWKGATYAVHRAEMVEPQQTSHLAVLTDISADVRAAEATALRDLLRVLNHELMNALTPVASMSKSALDLLGDDTPEARAAAAKALERVVARTEGLHDFINAYRALTRLPPPVMQPVALDEWLDVLRESFTAQWSDKGVVFECDRATATVLMDEDQMWLCAGNLLNNGAQAALEVPNPRVRLSVREVEGTVCLRIEDSGKGIPTGDADQVFLPFYTTKATGTGVGLSLAKQIVQGHGGALTLKAAVPGDPDRLSGACFEFGLKQV